MSDLCDPCVMGLHPSCEIWTCACTHADCPTPNQLTIDDALADLPPVALIRPVRGEDPDDFGLIYANPADDPREDDR